MDNLVFSNMLHRPARTVVSILGIAVGVLLIVFTIGLANGSMRERATREANVGAEILFHAPGAIGLSGSESFRIPLETGQELEKIEGVKTVVPIGQNSVSVDDSNTGSRLIDGVDFDQYSAVAGLKIIEGRKFAENSDEAIIDTGWQNQKSIKVGSTLKLYDRDFTIVGTYEPAAGARVKVSLPTMQKQLGGEGRATAFLVKVKDGFTPEQVADSIHFKFPENHVILAKNLPELYLSAVPALGVFLNVIIGVAAIISALVILLTMYTTVTERTRQIGIMKSLGMNNSKIAWIIVQEALLLSFCGIVTGIILTLLVRFILTRVTTLTVEMSPLVLFLIFVVGLVGGALGALYPALRAARLDAVEALSYE